jgi:hypothetical protein
MEYRHSRRSPSMRRVLCADRRMSPRGPKQLVRPVAVGPGMACEAFGIPFPVQAPGRSCGRAPPDVPRGMVKAGYAGHQGLAIAAEGQRIGGSPDRLDPRRDCTDRLGSRWRRRGLDDRDSGRSGTAAGRVPAGIADWLRQPGRFAGGRQVRHRLWAPFQIVSINMNNRIRRAAVQGARYAGGQNEREFSSNAAKIAERGPRRVARWQYSAVKRPSSGRTATGRQRGSTSAMTEGPRTRGRGISPSGVSLHNVRRAYTLPWVVPGAHADRLREP